ncbi:MAG: amino acid ABC transporter substrate-binding protein [Anaerolineae bacterium]|nr:amino acid ABC transporter substrate-binding protein [Anaerolineae bacterium]
MRPKASQPGLLLAGCCLLLAACGMSRPIKLGLSAPFEGRYRDLGYEALHAVRLAVRERNETGGTAGRYPIEMVALNDFNEPGEALVQARKMAADPDVLAVLGGWSPEVAAAAGPEYERLGLAFVAPPTGWSGTGYPPPGPAAAPPDEQKFKAGYKALSGGVPPGPVAVWAYIEANRALDAFDAAANRRLPTRDGILSLLAEP